MIVVSTFDGISVGRQALLKAGIPVKKYISSEIDKSAIKISESNFPDIIRLGDIRGINGGNSQVDLYIGGSSCQNFSFAGNKKGMSTTTNVKITSLEQYIHLRNNNFSFEGESYLFWEYVRLLRAIKPKYFLLENVNMKQEWQDVISAALEVSPIKINSSLISASSRNRLYWTNIPNVTIPEKIDISFDDINSNNQDWFSQEAVDKIKKWNAYQKPLDGATLIGSKSKLPCLTARGYNQSHSGMILITDGTQYRYLTNEEAEQAMTLPIGYTRVGTNKERSHALGNGWTADVITHIFKHI